jgi:hypothetical protein
MKPAALRRCRLGLIGDLGQTENSAQTLEHLAATGPASVINVGEDVFVSCQRQPDALRLAFACVFVMSVCCFFCFGLAPRELYPYKMIHEPYTTSMTPRFILSRTCSRLHHTGSSTCYPAILPSMPAYMPHLPAEERKKNAQPQGAAGHLASRQ